MGETSPFMAGMRGNFKYLMFLFFWCPSWGLGLEPFVPIMDSIDEQVKVMSDQLNTYRAFIRSILEELDDVNAVLTDIRNELKKVSEP